MNTNNASSGSGQRPECAALASLLALRETGMLDAEEADIVERHIASCDACQRDTALDATLAGHLRDALTLPAHTAPALTLQQIEHAVAAEERDAADSAASDASDAHAPAEHPGVSRRAAPLRSGAASRFGGLSALAAVLAVALLAAYIFGSHTGGTTRLGPVPATVTLSPKLSQETVYLPTAIGIYALRASDGVVRWAFPAGIVPSPNQAVHDVLDIFGLSLDHGTLYALTGAPGYGHFGDQEPRLCALNAANGSVRWSVRIPDLVTTSPFAPSLLQVGRLLVVAPTVRGVSTPVKDNQTVFAFSTANGNLVWRRTLDEPTLSNLVAAGGNVYIGTTGHVVALNAADGAILWVSPVVPSAQQEGVSMISVKLSAQGGRVYALTAREIGTRNYGSEIIVDDDLYALAASDGTHLWHDRAENALWGAISAPTLIGDTAFVTFGAGISAISLIGTTPERQWQFIPKDAAMPNPAMTGAVVSGGIVYTTDLSGVILPHHNGVNVANYTYAVRASDGAELWRTLSDGGPTASTPAIADGLLLAPAGIALRVFHAGNGQPLWQYVPPGEAHVATPLVGL